MSGSVSTLKARLVARKEREWFHPTWLSLFTNSAYFVVASRYRAILDHRRFVTGRALDFGCGAKPFKSLFAASSYTGLDIELDGGHDHSQENVDVFYDGKSIPFDDGSFDSVFSSDVFEHLFEIDLILKEIHRVMKSGGHLLFVMPFIYPEHEAPFDFGRYTAYGLKALMERHGFTVVTQKRLGTSIETIHQMMNYYVHNSLPSLKILAILVKLFVVPAINLSGVVLSKMLPSLETFYLGHVVVARKQ